MIRGGGGGLSEQRLKNFLKLLHEDRRIISMAKFRLWVCRCVHHGSDRRFLWFVFGAWPNTTQSYIFDVGSEV